MINQDIVYQVSKALVRAGSTFRPDKKDAYRRAIAKETNSRAKWILETTLENAEVAEKNKSPLCDDTGIPHVLIEMGPGKSISFEFIASIKEGIKRGLSLLPGRPMALLGSDVQRLNQSGGISMDPAEVELAPILIREIDEEIIRVHVLLFGGGPAIRGKTYRVFHKHDTNVVIDEIVDWATEGISLLGCTPSTIGIGIGRSHYEATALMLQALVDGNHNVQSAIENEITERLNKTNVGPIGLKGDTSVLATFLKVGPQRSSGVRIVSVIPCCSIEPRLCTVEL